MIFNPVVRCFPFERNIVCCFKQEMVLMDKSRNFNQNTWRFKRCTDYQVSALTLLVLLVSLFTCSRASPVVSGQQRDMFGALASSSAGIIIPADQVDALKAELALKHTPHLLGGNRGARASFQSDHHPVSAKRVSSSSLQLDGMKNVRRQEQDSKRWSTNLEAGTITIMNKEEEDLFEGSGFAPSRTSSSSTRILEDSDDEDFNEEEEAEEGSGASPPSFNKEEEKNKKIEENSIETEVNKTSGAESLTSSCLLLLITSSVLSFSSK